MTIRNIDYFSSGRSFDVWHCTKIENFWQTLSKVHLVCNTAYLESDFVQDVYHAKVAGKISCIEKNKVYRKFKTILNVRKQFKIICGDSATTKTPNTNLWRMKEATKKYAKFLSGKPLAPIPNNIVFFIFCFYINR